ncbi:glycoside hydrolase family 43 protein [Cylindrobasidium torrendii FP15055 ss-10]|uniref:Glycoside hydrolase family 43 protein n=1 Tax=Cylindrobasidium torrendii FP15055 ss-10 TaxID=1314674 RepID=A0A0D7B836_9AGAR|nr:glycoside hydrolase family 43 protein [Cylindrobasidium torrendii FP15055 ss-10]
MNSFSPSKYGADPCLRYLNGTYYLSATQNTDISIWAADTLEGLKTATRQVVFTDTTAGRDFDLWAPEFWYLDGRWYIYYAAAGNGDDGTHRLHVLAGGTDASDPTNGEYTYAASLIPSNFDEWAVDGSILELDGARYLIYSGKTEDEIWTQCTYAVELDSPTTLSGEAVQISCPTYDWEIAATPVQEGPNAITVGNTTYIVYSASHCSTDDYALGLLTLTAGADPLLATSWTKQPTPVFTKNVDAGVYGPGHHFMFEKEGEHLFAYHGKSEPGQGCGELRTTRVQPFSIEDGVPAFPVAVGVGVEVAEP